MAKNRELYGTTRTPEQLKKNRIYVAMKRAEMRTCALALLGGKCECCGESTPTVLTFDHINGGGRNTGGHGAGAIREILKMESPDSKYRVLCWNCHMSSSTFGYCPHNGRPLEDKLASRVWEKAKYSRQWNRGVRLETVKAYGGKCLVCGEENWEFLGIDHINGGGKQHRRELNKNGVWFYVWLRKQGYPQSEFQLLCFNCNEAKEMARRRNKQ